MQDFLGQRTIFARYPLPKSLPSWEGTYHRPRGLQKRNFAMRKYTWACTRVRKEVGISGKEVGNMEYLSKERYDEIVAEINFLINEEYPRIKDALAEARAQGDLSENFEYHAAKREQGKLLSRMRFVQRVLENARVVDKSLLNSDTVGLLSRVGITNVASNHSMSYTIVNPHEANLADGKISVKSPIAQALIGNKVGDVVEARVPAGVIKLRIDSIELS